MSRRSKSKTIRSKAATNYSVTPDTPRSEGRPAGGFSRWPVLGICILLAAITWVVFGQTLHHDFVNFDDNKYVLENPQVARGLTTEGIVWAFTHVHASNWHPVTWISHMLDCQFYRLNPGGHHLTNVLLHATTAILLFLVLRQMTDALWRSAFVAAIFVIHPLRVESVAWVAERKDVLSGLFFMLTIAAYIRYARHPRRTRYALVLLLFALGLMSKPMLVTLPFVLLLLDYWPLNRIGPVAGNGAPIWRRLIIEKLPLLGLAVVSCVITLFAQTETIRPLTNISVPLRVANAVISCAAYLRQMFWPSDLAVLYPFPVRGVRVTEVVLSALLLAGISVSVFVLRRRRYLLLGWLWYLITLGPVIGILQIGDQARADRYTYLPQIGLYLLLTWTAADLCARGPHRRLFLGVLSTIILLGLISSARTQASYWKNSESLWTHTLACTSGNNTAHRNFGYALYQKGRIEDAIGHYQRALQIDSAQAVVQFHLGLAFMRLGRMDECVTHFQKALEITPGYAEVHSALGVAFLQMGRAVESMAHLQKALEIEPNFGDAHYNLGNALLQSGLGNEALAHYNKALEIEPHDTETQNNMAWVLATWPEAQIRDGAKAVELAERADSLTGGRHARITATLAAAYAETGRFSDAAKTAQRALELSTRQGDTAFANSIRAQMEIYQSEFPFRDRRSPPVSR